jgi:hypothetical protein
MKYSLVSVPLVRDLVLQSWACGMGWSWTLVSLGPLIRPVGGHP